MTRICFLRVGATSLLLPGNLGEFGGAEVRAFTFARGLVQRGRQVEFAVAAHADLPRVSAEGIRIVALPPKIRGWKKLASSLRGRMSSVPQSFPAIDHIEANLIACFGVHRPTAQVVAAARAVGKKTILFLTSSEDVSTQACQSGKAKRQLIQHRYAVQHADCVVVQTESQQASLERSFGRPGTLIRNPIDTELDKDALLHYRSHVLWVGRADCDSKRADLCFELARRRPDIPFRVVMNGGDLGLLQELLSSKPSNVQVDTYVPFDQVERLYQTASVLINTSVSEGFPNAFLQAMKYRTPILSLNVDPDNVLARHDCGTVAGSIDRMTEMLSGYWPRGPWSVQQGVHARAYVTSHHELSGRIDQLEDLIERTAIDIAAA